MADLSKDQTENPTQPEAAVYKPGEWFTPLPRLDEIQKEDQDNPSKGSHWRFSFVIKGLGKFTMDFTHSDDYYKWLKQHPFRRNCLLVLPDRAESIKEESIDDWQRELETPVLMYQVTTFNPASGVRDIGIPSADNDPTKSPIYLEIELPSGAVLRSPFVDFLQHEFPRMPQTTYHHFGSISFIRDDKLSEETTLFPKGEFILKNTHFRIVKE